MTDHQTTDHQTSLRLEAHGRIMTGCDGDVAARVVVDEWGVTINDGSRFFQMSHGDVAALSRMSLDFQAAMKAVA